MINKIYNICKKKFITSKEHKRLCSAECKEMAYRQQHNLASTIYRNKNKKIINNNYRLRYKKNPTERKKYHKMYYLLNKTNRNEYRLKNKNKIAEYAKLYINKKRKTDLNFKLRDILRRRIWNALKNNIKSTKTIVLLGCSTEFLKKYLEKKFQVGMSWENYGKWHVDHIKPCSSFGLIKSEEQYKCFHYTNLQPLWAVENLKKGAR